MARHKKAVVDYFPHHVKHGKMMHTLEHDYGNEGYAFFYKLYELLGDAEGHFLKICKPVEWAYLLSVTDVSNEKARDIINTLIELEVVDGDLFHKHGMIWSQAFVDSVREVYARRKTECPQKPVPTGNPTSEIPLNGIPGVGNRQSKVKESRVEKEKTPADPPAQDQDKSELASLVDQCRVLFPKFNCILFIQNHNRHNIRAVIYVLKGLIKNHDTVANPTEWCKAAMKIQDGKENARDHEAKAQGEKGPWDVGAFMKQIAERGKS